MVEPNPEGPAPSQLSNEWAFRSMKHDRLCAIGHNLADSLAGGCVFIIGYHRTDVFADAQSSPGGLIEVDFLNGRVVRGHASETLESAVTQLGAALPAFCAKHDARLSDFRKLSAVFEADPRSRRVCLTVEDRRGRASTTEYYGNPLSRVRVTDHSGRVRRLPRRRPAQEI